jgi:hypothetical protein
MNAIQVIVTGPEEAYNNEAEFRCGNELGREARIATTRLADWSASRGEKAAAA